MKDVYRLENMTSEQLQGARQQMIDLGINENQVDRILMNEGAADAFNKRPIEIRQQFFEKVGAMDLGDIIRRRIETAPEEKPADLGATIRERIAAIGQQEKTAAQREQQVLAAAVPKVSPQGQVMETASAPPPRRARSFTEFLKGAVTGDPEVLKALRPDIVPERLTTLVNAWKPRPISPRQRLLNQPCKSWVRLLRLVSYPRSLLVRHQLDCPQLLHRLKSPRSATKSSKRNVELLVLIPLGCRAWQALELLAVKIP